jgi:hypothetical protein
MKSNITFVTSYLKIYDSEYDQNKTFEKRLELFMKIVELGINISIFISPEYENIFNNISEKYDNVKVIEVISINDLIFSKMVNNNTECCNLPQMRSIIKDLPNYMILMNSKIEFLYKTIIANPFNTEYFSWFDFSLPYIFKNLDKSLMELKKISFRNYIGSFITIPGCWNFKINDINFLKNKVSWRFCGGFFIGDKISLLNFYNTSINYFTDFLKLTNNILWEVNYWAWLESSGYISPLWFLADHNDSIICIPSCVYTKCIKDFTDLIVTYEYPDIICNDNDKFFPSSASYIYDFKNNKHIINTRYINYYYKDNWDCDFFNNRRQIKTVNIQSELNELFIPSNFNIMKIDETNLNVNNDSFSVGLEDIRLYYDNDNIKFIASNINYISCGKNRMIIGDYDYENNICKNLKIINMLWNSPCEKNWVPLPSYMNNNKLFIYKWSPYIIGIINSNDNFEIIFEKKYEDIILNRFRGSTPFIKYDNDTLIGVVHYSVIGVPPIYYHSLVLINSKTNLPLYYSDPFKFSEYKIEFCIGFSIINSEYLFWVSQMDREPILIKININKIEINNTIN